MKSNAYFKFSKSKINEKYKELKELCDIPSYSVKTNPDIVPVLEEETSSMFSIHTQESLERIDNKDRVLFFLQGVKKGEVEELVKRGVKKFVVDNESDLEIFLNDVKIIDSEVELLLRMKLKENTVNTGKYFVYGFNTRQVRELIPKLKDNQKINKLGIHFHRKTQNIGEWNILKELKDSYTQEIFDKIDTLNIGGGLPIKYKNYNYSKKVIESIKDKILELKDFINDYNIDLMIEPGRFICGPSGKLVTNIISIQKDTIIIDASVYNCAMDTFVADIKLFVENEKEKGEEYTIKGCTPDSMDIFRYKVYLQEEPKVGDQIIFTNAGAYTYSSNFCDLKKLPVKFIESFD